VITETPAFQILNEAMKGMKHVVIYLTTYLQVCFHHMSFYQCFDVNSERKKEIITGNLI
jgi:hypothetical protein